MVETQDIKKGYKQTALGVIPEEWEVKQLGDVVLFLDGKRKPIKDSDRAKMQGKYPYYGASGIIDYVNDYIFNEELILLGEDGANIINRSTPLAFKVSGKIWVNNHAHVLKPKNEYSIGYLTEALESIRYEKYNTGTAQPKLNKEVCSKILVPLPPLPEQRKIAEILSTWDEAIAQTKALIEQLKLRNKGLAQQLLTGKKRLKGFSGEWKEVKLGDLFEEIKEKNDGGSHEPLTISAKLGFVSQREKFDRIIAGGSLAKYTLIKKGEFSYNKGNSKTYPMGCIFLLEDYDSAVIPFVYISFRAKQNISNGFYKNWFANHGLDRQLKAIITSGARGDGLLNVNKKDFFSLMVPMLNLEEQKAIATILQNAEQELKMNQDTLESLMLQKQGLMQKLLTGEVRVKVSEL